MGWNPSVADGPVEAPILGDADPQTGDRALLGFAPGYRLNLPEALMTAALEPFRVTPQAPVRVLAGEATAFLKFDDEAQANGCAGLDALRLNGET